MGIISDEPIEAGVCILKLRFKGSLNYNDCILDFESFTIERATLDESFFIYDEPVGLIYNGEIQEATVTFDSEKHPKYSVPSFSVKYTADTAADPNATSFELDESGKPINAGTHSVNSYINADLNNNYNSVTIYLGDLEIARRPITGTVTIEEFENSEAGIKGKIEPGDTLYANTDAIGPRPLGKDSEPTLSYQWYKDGEVIEGATSAEFTIPTNADFANAKITVKVTGTHNYTGDISADLKNVNRLSLGGMLTIKGEDRLNSTIIIQDLVIGDHILVWMKNGVVISDENGTTYKLREGDYGKNIISVKAVGIGDYEGSDDIYITVTWIPGPNTAYVPDSNKDDNDSVILPPPSKDDNLDLGAGNEQTDETVAPAEEVTTVATEAAGNAPTGNSSIALAAIPVAICAAVVAKRKQLS